MLELRLLGYETKEIAEVLDLSLQQVKRYTSNLKQDRPGFNKSKPHEWAEIKGLSERGLTLEQIRTRTGRSITTIWKILNDKIHD